MSKQLSAYSICIHHKRQPIERLATGNHLQVNPVVAELLLHHLHHQDPEVVGFEQTTLIHLPMRKLEK